MIETEALPQLLGALTRARRLSHQRGRQVVVAIAGRCRAFDLIDVFERASTSPRLLWYRPEAEFAIVGIGYEHEITVQGRTRFADAADDWVDARVL